jgi:DNA polymerase
MELEKDLAALKEHLKIQKRLKNPGLLRSPAATPAAPATAETAAGPEDPGDPAAGLERIRTEIGDCTRCKLHATRNRLVFGAGSPTAELMFVGEGPGADEDRQGIPFVGRAGQLLTKIIAALGKSRDEVYIANIIKCRPPGNRNPEKDEIAACSPFLMRQIEVIRPKVICALGKFAAQTMLKSETPISRLRGRAHPFGDNCQLVPTFHPAYLLRNPAKKRETWEDMQLIMRILGWEKPATND